MEDLVLFRDRQELTPDDFNGLQDIVRRSIDRLISSAVTSENKYVGLNTAAQSANTIKVEPGAYFKGGRVYAVADETTLNLYENFPIEQKRYVLIVVTGTDDKPDQVEERDFLIDADSNDVEPQAVAMRSVRFGSVSKIAGTESVDPQAPVVPSGALLVATILLGSAGILSTTMSEENKLPSLKAHGEKITALESFKKITEPRLTAISSQIAALWEMANGKLNKADLVPVQRELARLKERVALPDGYYDYAADLFINDDETDAATAAGHTFTHGGVTFASTSALKNLQLLNPVEPNVLKFNTDWITPTQTSVPVLESGQFVGFSMTVSSFQTSSFVSNQLYAGGDGSRRVTGQFETVEEARDWLIKRGEDPVRSNNLFSSTGVDGSTVYKTVYYERGGSHYGPQAGEYITTNHTGALLAQTFLMPRSAWIGELAVMLTERSTVVADMTVMITRTKDGKPDLNGVLSQVTIPHHQIPAASLSTPWKFSIPPVFLEGGQRIGVVFVTTGNHAIGLAYDSGTFDGSAFYSHDGQWLMQPNGQGRDLWIRLYAQKFNVTRTEIPLQTVTLPGGITDLSYETEIIQPEGTQVYLEGKVAGVWTPLNVPGAITGEPDTIELRVVFVGTKDVQPAIRLKNNAIKVSRPGTTLQHRSAVRTLAAGKQNFVVDFYVANYDPDDADQVLTITMKHGVSYATTASASSVVEEPDSSGAYRVRATFAIGSNITTYKIQVDGTRTSAVPAYTLLERVDVAVS